MKSPLHTRGMNDRRDTTDAEHSYYPPELSHRADYRAKNARAGGGRAPLADIIASVLTQRS